jgi:hypothetical protein
MLDRRDTWSCSSAVIFPCRPPGSEAAAFSAARLQRINMFVRIADIPYWVQMFQPLAQPQLDGCHRTLTACAEQRKVW